MHDSDCTQEVCTIHPDCTIDATGLHTAACVSTFQARYDTHNDLMSVWAEFAKTIGIAVQWEAGPAKMLEIVMSYDRARTLYPKQPNI